MVAGSSHDTPQVAQVATGDNPLALRQAINCAAVALTKSGLPRWRNIATWVVKGSIDAEWDAYVSKLKSIGLDDAMKVYQDAYDRYKKQQG